MTGKKIGSILVLLFLICVNLSGCGGKRIADGFSMAQLNGKLEPVYAEDDFRTTYEVFVYSFFDSDGDGIGDLKGLDQKLDYIGSGDLTDDTSLGCTGIWMLPVFPSPTYHKYDAADYMSIDDQYGTMEDFEKLLSDCHARNIRLIMDLPLNHTSVEHPWFMAAADYLHELPPLIGSRQRTIALILIIIISPGRRGMAMPLWKERTGIMRPVSGAECRILTLIADLCAGRSQIS